MAASQVNYTPYSVNAQPQSGSGIWGGVAGSTALPNPFSDLSSVFPNLAPANASTSADIITQLQGQLSPETLNHLQDTAAQYGVASGMPGSGLQQNSYLASVAQAAQGLTTQGVSSYGSAVPTIKSTETVAPNWETQIAEANSLSAAQANPELQGLASLLSGIGGGAIAGINDIGGGGSVSAQQTADASGESGTDFNTYDTSDNVYDVNA